MSDPTITFETNEQDESVKVITYASGHVIRELDRPPLTRPETWPAFEFYRRFPVAVRIAVRALAATDPIADDFMRTLDHAIASGSLVVATDPDLAAALVYLQANPSGSPCMTADQAAALIA